MFSSVPMRLGMPLKYQMWETGAASSMWPMRSRRTLALVTSTPHLSQMTPLKRVRLYLPQLHSQSLVGPKMRSQNRPSRSGLYGIQICQFKQGALSFHPVNTVALAPIVSERLSGAKAEGVRIWLRRPKPVTRPGEGTGRD